MHKKFRKQYMLIKLNHNKVLSIGIGSVIVFIAMVIVAGIAAAVFIQTSNQLEAEALVTGRNTKTEISSELQCIQNNWSVW